MNDQIDINFFIDLSADLRVKASSIGSLVILGGLK